ncbi:uncharacterized protein LOC111318961 [Stylophora pistillata]|uniref:uncharacterized protein LOC111318961 n=1 Tax=Stylophora pistillata TaxID=50429 RepID=UPI000C041D8F|nr:uncharacterized protein LOC111318961 [Stylophora pistillata]
MSRLSTCLISVLFLLVILAGQISGLKWRRSPQIYPSDPADSFHQAFQAVPSTSVTAAKLMASFLGIGVNSIIAKRSQIDEDAVFVISGSGSIGECEFEKGRKALVR